MVLYAANTMKLLTIAEGLGIAAIFAVSMLLIVALKTRTERSLEGFLVADRTVPVWQAACSIAVSWVWAPAIFVCSQQAFTLGLPGIFWFTVPNIICFFLFAPLAKRLRKLSPMGYTVPEYIANRFPAHGAVHRAFLLGYGLNMVGAIVANAYAGGALLHELTGLQVHVAITLVSLIALSYSLISGLKASIYTDVIQMFMVLGLALVLVPWVALSIDDAPGRLLRGLSGIDGLHGDLFNPAVAFSMGIPMTITLITGPLVDQMFIQRAMAVRERDVSKTFVYGGLLFGLIPITLSLLGFFGVSLAQEGGISVSNPEMVGPLVISHVLPKVALYAFAMMALAALCSTLDSAMCAVSSLASIDIYQRYISQSASSEDVCRVARKAMIALTIIGTAIALCEPSMLWTFMITGVITAALYLPTITALYSSSISPTALVWAIVLSLGIAFPISIYATVSGNSDLLVYSSLASLVPGLFVALRASVR